MLLLRYMSSNNAPLLVALDPVDCDMSGTTGWRCWSELTQQINRCLASRWSVGFDVCAAGQFAVFLFIAPVGPPACCHDCTLGCSINHSRQCVTSTESSVHHLASSVTAFSLSVQFSYSFSPIRSNSDPGPNKLDCICWKTSNTQLERQAIL